jgi:hypothetical protein
LYGEGREVVIHLILTKDEREAKEYQSHVFRGLDAIESRIVSNVRQVEGLRGPFLLHFMTSWDRLCFFEREHIIDWINRDTMMRERPQDDESRTGLGAATHRALFGKDVVFDSISFVAHPPHEGSVELSEENPICSCGVSYVKVSDDGA